MIDPRPRREARTSPSRPAWLPRSVLAAVLLVACGSLSACGYTTSSLISNEYRTIAVPVFDNTTRRHDLEWELTRAVVDEITSRTSLRIVDLSDQPDLVLRGRLIDVDEDSLSRRPLQRIRENLLVLQAEITYETAGGNAVVSNRKVTERESVVPVKGETIRSSREELVRRLAEKIVRELEQGW